MCIRTYMYIHTVVRSDYETKSHNIVQTTLCTCTCTHHMYMYTYMYMYTSPVHVHIT